MIEFKYNDVVHELDYGTINGRTQNIYKDGNYAGRVWYIKDGGIESVEIEPEYRRQGLYRAALLDCLFKYNQSLLSFARNNDSDRFWLKFMSNLPEGVEIIEQNEDNNIYYILSKNENRN